MRFRGSYIFYIWTCIYSSTITWKDFHSLLNCLRNIAHSVLQVTYPFSDVMNIYYVNYWEKMRNILFIYWHTSYLFINPVLGKLLLPFHLFVNLEASVSAFSFNGSPSSEEFCDALQLTFENYVSNRDPCWQCFTFFQGTLWFCILI